MLKQRKKCGARFRKLNWKTIALSIMKNLKYYLVVLFAAITALISYATPSSNMLQYTICYASLFVVYFFIIKNLETEDVKWAIFSAIAIRFMLVPSSHFMSNDIWRYLWDGNMQALGFSPYTIAPKEVMDAGFNTFKGAGNLFHQILSVRENSVYPPLMQIVFYCCVKASLGNQILAIGLIKFILVVAEVVTFTTIIQLLNRFALPAKNIFIYAFNPIVIIEIVGNAHFEGVMLCFLLVGFLYYLQNKHKRAIVFYALSIATYIFPIVFLPIILFRNKWKQNLKLMILLSIVLLIISLIYFYGINVRLTYISSIQLFFNQFEYNSFVYYWINFLIPTNLQPAGGALLSRFLISISIIVFCVWCWKYKGLEIEKLLPKILIFWSIFILFFTVINPWYLAPLIILTVFRKSYAILLWSALAIAASIITSQVENHFTAHCINSIWYIMFVVVFIWKDLKFFKN